MLHSDMEVTHEQGTGSGSCSWNDSIEIASYPSYEGGTERRWVRASVLG